MSSRSPNDAAARAEALDPSRSFIVQAPAGSGKTELLTQRFLRLLAFVQSPEQILAITFTRKAAAEMRSRILRALETAQHPRPEAAHKRATWELARAVLEADARLGWRLTEHPARLRIQTIDALNAYFAKRLPVLSAAGAALEPSDDPQPLYEAACRQLIARLGEGQEDLRELESLIAHVGNRVERLIAMLSELLARRDQWLHQVVNARSLEDLRSVLEDTLRALVERRLARVCELLNASRRRELAELARFAADNLKAEGKARAEMLGPCLSFVGIPDASSGCLPVWRAIVSLLLKKDGELLQKLDARHGFPKTHPQEKARMQRLLDDLASETSVLDELKDVLTLPDPAYSTYQWRIVEALLEILPLAVGELQLVFQKEGKGDYVEASLRALQALGAAEEPTDLALAFDYRLQHILVDEFQDTSYTQLDLLERLTAGWSPGDGRTVFCVGDPMQSIYRFRQADVGLFLQLQAQGLRNVQLLPLQLTANFRSSEPIVSWVNRVFPRVFAERSDAESGAVTFSPSEPAAGVDAGAVQVHAAVHEDDYAESRAVIDVVRAELERRTDTRIAILASARSHVAVLARALTHAGVDYEAVEIELLGERPVVQDLIALTRALTHLADRTAWLAVLRAPWCGLSLADLHALAADDRDSTIRMLLQRQLHGGGAQPAETAPPARRGRLRRPASDRQLAFAWPNGVPALALSEEGRRRVERVFHVLERALEQRGRLSLREWVERTWTTLGAPATLPHAQDLGDAQSFFERLERIESAGELDDVAALETRLQRLFAQPRGEPAGRVELMTIHKAKGLEFDVVILPGLHRSARADEADLLRWARIAAPQGGIVLAPIKADGAAPDPIYRWVESLERERTAHERARLLYVAVTRAKRELHLFGGCRATADDSGARVTTPRAGAMLHMLWSEVSSAFDAALQSAIPAASPGEASFVSAPIRRLPLSWRAPPADPSAPGAEWVSAVDLQRPEFDWVSEVSRHVGTLVHRELDRLRDSDGPRSLHAARPRLIAELTELGVPPDRCEQACERVLAAVGRTLADPRGRWLLGHEGSVREVESELALSGVLGGEQIDGVIDRTFVDEAGVRWVVDFKTSTHSGGGLEQFLRSEVERYRPQLARYMRLMKLYRPAEPVRAALYFPLLSVWREVSFD